MEETYYKLFVGDRLHVVSETTLRANDDTYFIDLIDVIPEERKNKLDIIFIDRDGKHFADILNHLRGCLNLDHWKTKDLKELLKEAYFYRLSSLSELLELVIENRHVYQTIGEDSDGLILMYRSKDLLMSLCTLKTVPAFIIEFSFDEIYDLRKQYEAILHGIRLKLEPFIPELFEVYQGHCENSHHLTKLIKVWFYEAKSKDLTQVYTIKMREDLDEIVLRISYEILFKLTLMSINIETDSN